MKAMQDEKDFPQRGRNVTFLLGTRITEIFTSSALFHPEGDKLIFFFFKFSIKDPIFP